VRFANSLSQMVSAVLGKADERAVLGADSPQSLPPDATGLLDDEALALLVLCEPPNPTLPLCAEHARIALRHLSVISVPSGSVLIEERDGRATDFMLVLLSGEVRVETTVNPGIEPEVFAVRTAGVAMGAAGFMDGRPRWGTHLALTPVRCLKITRAGLASLVDEDAQAGARLLLVIGRMMAGVQREQIDRIKVSARIGRSLQEQIEIDRQTAPRRDSGG